MKAWAALLEMSLPAMEMMEVWMTLEKSGDDVGRISGSEKS